MPQSKSYMWLFRSGNDGLNLSIVYKYHPTRNGDAAAKFFAGSDPGTYINVDGYAGYNKLKDFKRFAVMHTSEDISWRRSRRARKRTIRIWQYRDSSIAINSLNVSGVTISYKQIYNRRLKDQGKRQIIRLTIK